MKVSIMHMFRRSRIVKCSALILGLMASIPTFGTNIHAQSNQCVDCTPETNQVVLSGEYFVCVEPDEFSPTQVTAMQNGAEYWAAPRRQNGHAISFNIQVHDETDPDCDMTIVAETVSGGEALGEATTNGHGARITGGTHISGINTGSGDYWGEIFGHEWGHIFGFRNVDNPDCSGVSLMYVETAMGRLPSERLCSDLNALATRYSVTATPDGHEESVPTDPPEEDMECWEVYLVTYTWYIWTDGTVTQGATRWEYLYTDCVESE